MCVCVCACMCLKPHCPHGMGEFRLSNPVCQRANWKCQFHFTLLRILSLPHPHPTTYLMLKWIRSSHIAADVRFQSAAFTSPSTIRPPPSLPLPISSFQTPLPPSFPLTTHPLLPPSFLISSPPCLLLSPFFRDHSTVTHLLFLHVYLWNMSVLVNMDLCLCACSGCVSVCNEQAGANHYAN